MADQRKHGEAQNEKKSRLVNQVASAGAPFAALDPLEQTGLPVRAAFAGSAEDQASRLGDAQILSAQRQALATQIGTLQGNAHLQRLISKVHAKPGEPGNGQGNGNGHHGNSHKPVGLSSKSQESPRETASAEETLEGTGSGGALQASAPGLPPPDDGKPGRRRGLSLVSADLLKDTIYPGDASTGLLQRQEAGEEDSGAASALLSQLFGTADTEKDEIASERGTKGGEMESEQATQQSQAQASADAAGSQLQADGSAQEASLQAQGEASSEQILAQAETAQGELNGQFSDLESQALTASSSLEDQVTTRVGELQDQGSAFESQVQAVWGTTQAQGTAQVSFLEGQARSLFAASQAKARKHLESEEGGEESVNAAERDISSGWSELMEILEPFIDGIQTLWDFLSRQVTRLWEAVQAVIGRISAWIGEQLTAIWNFIQERWRRLVSFAEGVVGRVKDFVVNLANRFITWATEAWNSLKTRVTSIVQGLRQTIDSLLGTLRERGNTLIMDLRGTARSAISTVSGLASRIASLFGERAQNIVNGVTNFGNSSVDWLAGKALGAFNDGMNFAQQKWGQIQDLGNQVWTNAKDLGTGMGQRLQVTGNRAVDLANRAWGLIQRGWNYLEGRVNQVINRLRQKVDGMIDQLTRQTLPGIWRWLEQRWENFKNNTIGLVGKIIRGYRRLRAWAGSARQRAASESQDVLDAVEQEARGYADAPFEAIFYKGQPGGVRDDQVDPVCLQRQMGKGHPLESSVRARMEAAFGKSLSSVSVHTDARAAGLTGVLNARAFAVGNRMAFAPGEYQPGTLIGDALIAHELAHVIQQSAASTGPTQSGPVARSLDEDSGVEMDADRSAINAVAALYAGEQDALSQIPAEDLPRLRTGLRLSSCRRKKTTCPPGTTPPKVDITDINQVSVPSLMGKVMRIPPNAPQEVFANVQFYQDCMAPIVLSVERAGGSGSATINDEKQIELDENGVTPFTLVGTSQTVAPDQLRLVARVEMPDAKGKVSRTEVGRSNDFFIAAYPTGITFSPAGKVEGSAVPSSNPLLAGLRAWGASYKLSLQTDSPNPKDAFDVKISENIGGTGTGIFGSGKIGQSGFFQATFFQNDTHAAVDVDADSLKKRMDASPQSDATQDQFFRFSDEHSGITEDRAAGPIVPNSGFRIFLQALKDGYVVTVTKQGEQTQSGPGTVTDKSMITANVK